jgi:hypothetical protein
LAGLFSLKIHYLDGPCAKLDPDSEIVLLTESLVSKLQQQA